MCNRRHTIALNLMSYHLWLTTLQCQFTKLQQLHKNSSEL